MCTNLFNYYGSGLICNPTQQSVRIALDIEDDTVLGKDARTRVPILNIIRSLPVC